MGQAMVRRFTLSGASVATTARSPLPDGQAVALFVQTDIGTAAGVQDVISRIQQEWGGLDILVNNVGGSDAPNGGYKALSDDDWQKALNVNLLVSAVLFHMTRKLRGVRSRLRKRCLTVLDRHVISVQLPWDSNGVEIPK